MTSKMYERINWYKKEFVYEQYARIVENFKEYDKITKTKMLDAIYKVYNDYNNIIDICTAREIKFLKKVINKETNIKELFDEKYEWERKTLSSKFLIQDDYPNIIFIPDEIIEKVKEALKNVDLTIVKRKDDLNEIIVSYCKIQASSILNTVCTFCSVLTGISENEIFNHVMNNKLFKYYVMVYPKNIKGLGDNIFVALHQDYYSIEEEIEIERSRQGLVGPLKIDLETYKTLFYNEFDITNKKIAKFLEELKKLPFFWFTSIDLIKEFAVLNIDRKPLKESFSSVPALKDYDLTDFFKLLDEAMDEMPSGVLNGFTPNEAKRIKAEEIKRNINKNNNYVKQKDACLSEKNAKLFYKIYFGLLEFTNNKYKIMPKLKIYNKLGINPYDLRDIIDVFWQNKELIVLEFCIANPYNFTSEELKITGEFKKGFRDIFIIAKFEKEYTALMNKDKIYMIKGINDNLDNIISFRNLPYICITAIIPFKNVLIYDGILLEMGIKMGSEFEKIVENEFRNSIKYYHL